MTRRTVLVAVAAWVAVVALGSGVTWLVIDSAGQTVLSASPGARTTVPVPAQAASSAPPASPGHPHRRVRPAETVSPSPGAAPGPARTSGPAPTPAPGPPSGAVSSQAGSRQGTWRGAGGSVVVTCAGATAALRAATPSDGYRVEVGDRGPHEIEVTFKGPAETQVKARCRAGAPAFAVETDRSGED